MRRLSGNRRLSNTVAKYMDLMMIPVRSSSRQSLIQRNTNASGRSGAAMVAIAASAIVIICYLLVVGDGVQQARKRYEIVIDGGSTGSRIHVFEFVMEDEAPVFDFSGGSWETLRVSPGLSAYVAAPDMAGESLQNLLEFGKRRVPVSEWEFTEIRLMATAGMRLLEIEAQNRILESCRRVLSSSGFEFQDDWASVISGSDEGMYAWVTANYALGTLGGSPRNTTGIIELGGASAQVTFASDDETLTEYSRTLTLFNASYNLFSHSYLNFGQNAAFDSLQESLFSEVQKQLVDPCTPKGYFYGNGYPSHQILMESGFSLQATGNFSDCKLAALKLLQKGEVPLRRPGGSVQQQCDLSPVFFPRLDGGFLATENFFYTSEFLGVAGEGSSLSDVARAGEGFCRMEWGEMKARYGSAADDDLLRYCFSSAYIVALLHHGFGVRMHDKRIEFTNRVGGVPLEWAFGAVVVKGVSAAEEERRGDPGDTIVEEEPGRRVPYAPVGVVSLLIVWSVLKWNNPRLKTIYDLEKGRYIITHLTRS